MINTHLTVKELATTFQESARAQVKGWKAAAAAVSRLSDRREDDGFFTPRVEGPFASLADQPAFCVGFIIPKFGGGAVGNGHPVHMYVWDKGTHREVELYAPHGLGGGSPAALRLAKFVPFFTAADPTAQVGAVS